MLGKISVIAIPSILQQSFISVGNIVIQSVVNSFGASVIAGYSASVKLNNLVITSFTTLANGISNYTSQNLGAGKLDRMHQGYIAGVKLVWALCVPLAALYFFAGRLLLLLFMNEPTGTAIDTGILFLRIVAPFYFLVSVKLVSDGVLARLRPDGPVHDLHLRRPDPPCGSGRGPVFHRPGFRRHLAVLAHWLDRGHRPLAGLSACGPSARQKHR